MKNITVEQINKAIESNSGDMDFIGYIHDADIKDIFESSVSIIEVAEAIKDFFIDHDSRSEMCDAEVIYHAVAMEYLSENDPSLNESMELAQDMGYEPKDINSELLASLLQTQDNQNSYDDLCDDIEGAIIELGAE